MTVTYLSRDDWGAGPLTAGSAAPHRQFVGLIIHHTVMDYWGDPVAYMRRLQKVRPDLSNDVPYSFVIMPGATHDDCVVAEGRGFGRTGAHTVGYNSTAYGVSFAGNFTDNPPTRGMLEGVRWIGRRLADPINALHTLGHRDTGYGTACPGDATVPLLGFLQPPFTEPDIDEPEEDDMQLTDQTTNGWTVNDALNWGVEGINRIEAAVARLEARLLALETGAGASAEAVADELAARLRD